MSPQRPGDQQRADDRRRQQVRQHGASGPSSYRFGSEVNTLSCYSLVRLQVSCTGEKSILTFTSTWLLSHKHLGSTDLYRKKFVLN